MDLRKYTTEKLVNLHDRIVDLWHKRAEGGDRYGVDSPTAYALWPLSWNLRYAIRVEMLRRFHA